MPSADKDVRAILRSEKEMESNQGKTIIYLTEERRFGYLLTLGAFVSRVEYVDDFGNTIDSFVENDEFEIWESEIYEQE